MRLRKAITEKFTEEAVEIAPDNFLSLAYPDGQTVKNFMDSITDGNPFEKAIQRASIEGVKQIEKQIPGTFEETELEKAAQWDWSDKKAFDSVSAGGSEGQATSPSVQTSEGIIHTEEKKKTKKSSIDSDMIDAVEIFYKRLIQERDKITLSDIKLLKSDESDKDNVINTYSMNLVVHEVGKLFSSIVGYNISFNEDLSGLLLDNLLLDLSFEDTVYNIISSSDKGKIGIEVAGEKLEVPIPRDNFVIDKLSLDNDILTVEISFIIIT